MSIYKFVKDSSLVRPRNISKEQFISASYGDEFIYEPLDIPIRIYHFSGSSLQSQDYKLFRSLKNTINYYSANDNLFVYDNLQNKPITLYCFNSAHLGAGLQKGSVELNMYLSGNIIASAADHREDGILYSKENDEKIGFVLYGEGFIAINNTASLSTDICKFSTNYENFSDEPRWIHAFASASDSLFFDINYNTKNDVATNTMFVFAEKNSLNHSNNDTYIKSGSYSVSTGSYHFTENDNMEIKNTVRSPFISGSANFQKQTFISRIGLFDEEKKLIGIASLANPVKKTENREFLFKLKIDI